MPRSPQTVNDRWHDDTKAPDKASRPRDSALTRARILDAAQQLFPLRGYAHVGMREIAALAGVDVKMAARYFGSKEKLFHAALLASVGADALWKRPKAGFGRTVVEMFVDELDAAVNPLRMLMQAASDPAAKAVALDFLRTELVASMATWLGPPDAEARATQILALCAGLFTYRVMLPLDQFSGPLDPASRRWLETALQAVVDGPAAG
jgi:AcrR family transcriptional regulator